MTNKVTFDDKGNPINDLVRNKHGCAHILVRTGTEIPDFYNPNKTFIKWETNWYYITQNIWTNQATKQDYLGIRRDLLSLWATENSIKVLVFNRNRDEYILTTSKELINKFNDLDKTDDNNFVKNAEGKLLVKLPIEEWLSAPTEEYNGDYNHKRFWHPEYIGMCSYNNGARARTPLVVHGKKDVVYGSIKDFYNDAKKLGYDKSIKWFGKQIRNNGKINIPGKGDLLVDIIGVVPASQETVTTVSLTVNKSGIHDSNNKDSHIYPTRRVPSGKLTESNMALNNHGIGNIITVKETVPEWAGFQDPNYFGNTNTGNFGKLSDDNPEDVLYMNMINQLGIKEISVAWERK